MNEKYYSDLFGGKKYGDYLIYGEDLPKNDYISDYGDMYNKIIKYYNIETVEESEEQKAKRLAKEKAEKRNKTIDQILGE